MTTSHSTTTTSTDPRELPQTLERFLAAHEARDAPAALRELAPTAVVVDDGRTYRGTEQLLAFLAEAGTEFTYTTRRLRTQDLGKGRWVVTLHLEGDFPGGVVDLDYRFTLDGDLVTELVITA